MVRVLVSVLLPVLFSFSLLAQDSSQVPLSKSGAKLHLFETGDSRFSPRADNLLQTQQSRKSVGLAAIYSLLLPGMGELYADGFRSGRYFLGVEGLLWLTFASFEVYGNAIRDDARSYAAARGGINIAGKDDQFFVDVGNFLDVNEYNEKQLRDREPEKLYDPAQGYGWKWESDAARLAYRDQRVESETMFNNKKFVVAAILINHIGSAINAARSAISFNKELDEVLGDLSIKADVMGGFLGAHGIVLTASRSLW